MSRGRVPLVVAASIAIALSAPSVRPAAQAQQPGRTFRAGVDVVTIDVSVRSNGDPVGGLRAEDFVLTDNGVRQQVEVVALEAVPVEISILVETTEDVADDLPRVAEHARAIAAMARPTDQVRLMRVSSTASDIIPLRPASTMAPIGPFVAGGLPSPHDAIAAALMRPVGQDRRHLIIALTNGIDAISTLRARDLVAIAERSDATLNIAQVDVAGDPMNLDLYIGGRERLVREQLGNAMLTADPRPYWRPFDDEQFTVLGEAARATGGDIYMPGVFTNRTAAAVFEKAFADFKRSYLLRYTPQGVKREGWHDVTVTVPQYPSYRIHARRGYDVEPGTPPTAAPAAATPPPTRMDTFDDLAAAYDRGDYAGVTAWLNASRDLTPAMRELRQSPTRWPAAPRREAAFVIELADAALRSRRPADMLAARELLSEYPRLVRHPIQPDPFERYWLWAALAIQQGGVRSFGVRTAIDDAMARFPDEPRFLLARAVLSDVVQPESWLGTDRRLSAFSERRMEQVAELYDAAIAHPATAAEARVRKAWLLHRAGFDNDALALLDVEPVPGATTDAAVLHWRELFRGRVLDALNRSPDAVAAYRRALALVPTAQSARVGLMAALLKSGERGEAEALAQSIETAAAEAVDPWWTYWLGDRRLFNDIVRRLREQTR